MVPMHQVPLKGLVFLVVLLRQLPLLIVVTLRGNHGTSSSRREKRSSSNAEAPFAVWRREAAEVGGIVMGTVHFLRFGKAKREAGQRAITEPAAAATQRT